MARLDENLDRALELGAKLFFLRTGRQAASLKEICAELVRVALEEPVN